MIMIASPSFVLICAATLAAGFPSFAAGQPSLSGDGPRGEAEAVPKNDRERLQATLLIRQMVLDRYDTTGTGVLSEKDKTRLVEDARAARREARKKFMMQFDRDGDGKLSPEEYKTFREHVKKRRGLRRLEASPAGRRDGPAPSPSSGESEIPMVEVRTPAQRRFMVAPGLFLLARNMLLEKYDANGNGRIEPEEHAVVMRDTAVLYQARMKEMVELYDLDRNGTLSSVEREQALANSHQDSPLYSMEEPDDIDLFIRANISEVLLKEVPADHTEEQDGGME